MQWVMHDYKKHNFYNTIKQHVNAHPETILRLLHSLDFALKLIINIYIK